MSSRFVATRLSACVQEAIADPSQAEAVRHIETTLARSLFNCDEAYCLPMSPIATDMLTTSSALHMAAQPWPFVTVWSLTGIRRSRTRLSLTRSASTVRKRSRRYHTLELMDGQICR